MSRLFARGKPCHPFGLTAGGSASGAYPPPVKPVIKIARKLLFLLSCLEHTFGRGVGGVAITRTIKTETFRSFLPLVSSGRGDFPSGTGAVMLRTEPAALSLPGPSGAAGFHPRLSQRQGQACSIRKRMRRQVAPFLRSMHPVPGCKGQRC